MAFFASLSFSCTRNPPSASESHESNFVRVKKVVLKSVSLFIEIAYCFFSLEFELFEIHWSSSNGTGWRVLRLAKIVECLLKKGLC
jgi:hypothetical protein